ncbi:hypothetical protein GCM10029992_05810 [Glycomyces albus]
MLAASALLLVAAGSSSWGGDPASAQTDEESGEAAAHTEALLPEIALPDGFAELEGEQTPYVLEYENVGTAYGYDGSGTEVIYVTSYLLPEDGVPENYQQMAPYVEQYNQVSANQVGDDVTTHSITSGFQGIFRYAEIDVDGANVYQRNFFVFDGRLMVHISCQWQASRDEITSGCRDLSTDLTMPTPQGGE